VTPAFTFNVNTYQNGFAKKLGLDDSASHDALTCYTSVAKVFEKASNLFQRNSMYPDIQAITTGVLNIYSEMKTEVLNKCQLYIFDLALYAMRQTWGQDLGSIINQNFAKFYPDIFQQFDIANKALMNEENFKAGQTHAYIFQILIGLEEPEVLPMPKYNSEAFKPFEPEKFAQEYFEGLFTTIRSSSNQTSVDLHRKCFLHVYNNAFDVAETIDRLAYLSTIEEQLLASKEVYSQVIDLILPCMAALRDEWEHNTLLIGAYLEQPFLVYFYAYYNLLVTLPQTVALSFEYDVSSFEGRYFDSGVAHGKIFNHITSKIDDLAVYSDVAHSKIFNHSASKGYAFSDL